MRVHVVYCLYFQNQQSATALAASKETGPLLSNNCIIHQSITERIKKCTRIIYCSLHFTYVICSASNRIILACNAKKQLQRKKKTLGEKKSQKEARKFILWGVVIIASDKNIRLHFDCSIVRVPFEWIALARTHTCNVRHTPYWLNRSFYECVAK